MQATDWRMEAARRGVDLTRLPRHIAMIMDGNGRWARARGLHRLVGHANGHSTVRRMVLGCAELGIDALSLYTFSTENWRRPQEEVQGLMRLLERSAREELPVMMRNGVQITRAEFEALMEAGVFPREERLDWRLTSCGTRCGRWRCWRRSTRCWGCSWSVSGWRILAMRWRMRRLSARGWRGCWAGGWATRCC